MVKALAKFCVKDGNIETFLPLMEEMVKITNEEDKGCIEYQPFNDKENPNVVWLIEEWDSREELDAHMQTPHIKRIIPQITPLLEKEIEVHILTRT